MTQDNHVQTFLHMQCFWPVTPGGKVGEEGGERHLT